MKKKPTLLIILATPCGLWDLCRSCQSVCHISRKWDRNQPHGWYTGLPTLGVCYILSPPFEKHHLCAFFNLAEPCQLHKCYSFLQLQQTTVLCQFFLWILVKWDWSWSLWESTERAEMWKFVLLFLPPSKKEESQPLFVLSSDTGKEKLLCVTSLHEADLSLVLVWSTVTS